MARRIMPLLDRIKFDAGSDDWFVWKHPSEELRLGGQLIVNHSQEALFVRGGKICDLFQAGTHTLTSANVPLLTKLAGVPFGGKSPFSAEVWYVNKATKRDLLWGTKSPIPLMDPVFNYPVSVRAHGRWGIQVTDSQRLVAALVGTLTGLESGRIESYFIGELIQKITDSLAKAIVNGGASVLHVNAHLNELATETKTSIGAELAMFGLSIVNFNIERISVPSDELKKFQEVFGKRMEIEQISKAQLGPAYSAMRSFDTLEKAATSDGSVVGGLLAGGVGIGLGVGAGATAAKELGRMIDVGKAGDSTATGGVSVERLRELKTALAEGLITQEEFDRAKIKILDAI